MIGNEEQRTRTQARINEATTGLRYSPYLDGFATDLQQRLLRARRSEGLEGIEEILDEFDSLARSESRDRIRYALLVTLVKDSGLPALGLKTPGFGNG